MNFCCLYTFGCYSYFAAETERYLFSFHLTLTPLPADFAFSPYVWLAVMLFIFGVFFFFLYFMNIYNIHLSSNVCWHCAVHIGTNKTKVYGNCIRNIDRSGQCEKEKEICR